MLQRRFRIGYNRAARIIDEIEEKGIIGPSDGSRPRQLLMTEDEYYGTYPETVIEAEAEIVEETDEQDLTDDSGAVEEPEVSVKKENNGRMSNTRAMDSFNSLPESVRRMVMDADSNSDY